MKRSRHLRETSRRRGALLVLAAVVLALAVAFFAFWVDVGFVTFTKAELQVAANNATLAAAVKMNSSLDAEDVGTTARRAAGDERTKHQASSRSSIVIDATCDDIRFGRRTWKSEAQRYDYQWGPSAAPYNVVSVTARRNGNGTPPVNRIFVPLIDQSETDLHATAMATFQPRDILLVLDYSSSMNDDSELKSVGRLPQADIERNLHEIWQDLGAPEFGTMSFTPQPLFGSIGHIKSQLGLDNEPYPYPDGSWSDYIHYVQNSDSLDAAGYRNHYGAMTLINYWLQRRPMSSETPDLWRVKAQPITALKDSIRYFVDYLERVDSEDAAGLCIYTVPQLGGAKLESPLTRNLQVVEDISRRRQAGHYGHCTNIGAGMQVARMELEANARPGAFRMMVLMTDGRANRPENDPIRFALSEARAAKQAGIKVFTISLGSAADTALMQQIADLTGGEHFNVPGDGSDADYQRHLKDAFREIADKRPVKLID